MSSNKISNTAMQAIFKEINTGKPANKAAKEIEAINPTDIKVLPSKTTAKVLKQFKEDCILRRRAKAKLDKVTKELKSTIKAAEERITSQVSKYGVIPLQRPDNRILYAQPYKAELVAVKSGGSVDAAKVLEVFPELIDSKSNLKIDMEQLQTALDRVQAPPALRQLFQTMQKEIAKLEQQTEIKILQYEDLGLLNFDTYEQYKESGKITKEMEALFEGVEIKYRLDIDPLKLSDNPHCTKCGERKPKRKKSDTAKHNCKRCGHAE